MAPDNGLDLQGGPFKVKAFGVYAIMILLAAGGIGITLFAVYVLSMQARINHESLTTQLEAKSVILQAQMDRSHDQLLRQCSGTKGKN